MSHPLIIPPRPALLPWIHHIMVVPWPAAPVTRIPAVLSPNIIVFPRGAACLESLEGGLQPLPRACLKGPCLEPRKVLCGPDSAFISILFRVGFMAEALGPAVGEFTDRIIPLDCLVSPGRLSLMLARMDEETDPRRWVELVQDLLLDSLWEGRNPRRPAAGLGDMGNLFKPAGMIATDLGIGVRQLERRLEHAYGTNLRDARRMVRFGYSLARLIAASLRRGDLARIAQDFGYYDQSHMDRDFRTLAGIPPREILDASGGGDPSLWLYRFGKRDFRDLFLAEDVDSVQETVFGRG